MEQPFSLSSRSKYQYAFHTSGGQKKRYKDTLKACLGNRLHRGDQSNEVSSTKEQLSTKEKRICEAERKRRERKAKTNGPPADSMKLLYLQPTV